MTWMFGTMFDGNFVLFCFVTAGLCWTAEEDEGDIKGSGSNVEREGINHFKSCGCVELAHVGMETWCIR